MGKMPAFGLAGAVLAGALLSGCWNRDTNRDIAGTTGTSGINQTAGVTQNRTYNPQPTVPGVQLPVRGMTASAVGQGNGGAQNFGTQIPAGTALPQQGSAWDNRTGASVPQNGFGSGASATGGLGGGTQPPGGISSPGTFPTRVPPDGSRMTGDDASGTPGAGMATGGGLGGAQGAAVPVGGNTGGIRQTSSVLPQQPGDPIQPPPGPGVGAGGLPSSPGNGGAAPVTSRYPYPGSPGGAPVSPGGGPVVPIPPPSAPTMPPGQNLEP